jgi:hypothetical protein
VPWGMRGVPPSGAAAATRPAGARMRLWTFLPSQPPEEKRSLG